MLDALRRIVLSPLVRIVAAVAVLWLLFAWFAVGPILKWAAPKFVAANGERVLTIERAHFNPFRLSLAVEGARLTEPDGAPLLAFERFLADFEIASIVRGAWSFREVVLDAPSTLIALRADGSLNWLEFAKGFASEEPAPEPESDGPPRLLIDRLAVTRGMADFSDRKFADDFETRIEPIDFEVHELSTLPDEEGEHRLQLRTEIGAQLQWQGTLGLNPVLATGEVVLSDLVFERIWPYLEPRLAMAPPKGVGEVRFAYRLGYENGDMSMVLDHIAASIKELGIAGAEEAEPGIRLDSIRLAGGHFDLQARQASAESLEVMGGRIAARRGADGEVDMASWFAPPADEAPPASAPPAESGTPVESEAPRGSGAPAKSAAPVQSEASAQSAAPGRSEAPTSGSPAGDESWRFGIGRVALDDIAMHYRDEGFARPLSADIGKVHIGFKFDGDSGEPEPQVQIDELGVELSGISLAAEGIEEPVLGLASVSLESGKADLAQRAVTIGGIRFKGVKLAAARGADGAIAVVDAFAPAGAATTPAAKQADEARSDAATAGAREAKPSRAGATEAGEGAWRYRVDQVTLDGGEVTLRDAAVEPAATLVLEDIHVAVNEISENLSAKWPVKARFAVRGGGKFDADGSVVAGKPSGDLQLELSGLGLAIAQPYLSEVARLRIVGGSLASAGRLRFGDEGVRYEGGFDLGGLDLHELETKETLLGWKSLSTKQLSVREDGVAIGEVLLDSLRSKLVIFEDRTVNVAKVVGPAEKEEQEKVADAAESRGVKPTGSNGEPAFKVSVERLRVVDGDVDFADLSLALPFGTRVHELKGELAGLSNDPDSAATIALDGKVDEYGSAKVGGEINLFAPGEHTDAKVEFRNVEMTKLTPYSATFAGRRIASGKLSLDLEYRIEDQQLRGDNRIVMDQLTLGEKVESEDAPNLPLDLAVAILKDSQGRIDLGLPVSGSLEDPEFSFGGLVGKALLGLVTKIVTAPFRALGALFGGGGGEDVDMSQVAFDAGSAELPGREREKLGRLAEALGKRPNLALEIEPGVNREADGMALRDVQLRRTIASRLGRSAKPAEDPGPLALSDGATRSALESLFIERFNAHELRQLQETASRGDTAGGDAGASEGAEGANVIGAGGSASNAAGPGGDAAPSKSSGESKVYRQVFERLREAETLDEAALAALGKARGEAIRAELEAKGLAAERMSVAQPAEREAKDGAVLVGLGLDAQASGAGAPAAASGDAPAEAPAKSPRKSPAETPRKSPAEAAAEAPAKAPAKAPGDAPAGQQAPAPARGNDAPANDAPANDRPRPAPAPVQVPD